MELRHETAPIIIKQFFGIDQAFGAEMQYPDRRDTFWRWTGLGEALISNDFDNSDSLWSKRDFRLGYKMVLEIIEALDDRENRQFNPWDFIEGTIGYALEHTCENPVETMNLLIEAAKPAVVSDEEMGDEEKVEIMKDLKVMLVLAKMVAQFKNSLEGHKHDLEEAVSLS